MNISELRQRAELGSVVAQAVLGACYLDGIDVEVNYVEARRLLSGAAAHGVPRACMNLGRMNAEGLGGPQNLSEAIRLFEIAANGGEFLAQVELGRMYSRGTGVQVDHATARRWYSAAAGQAGKVGDCVELREATRYLANAG